jgi:hypothetical protein
MRVGSLDTSAEDRLGYSRKFSFGKVGVGHWSLNWLLEEVAQQRRKQWSVIATSSSIDP